MAKNLDHYAIIIGIDRYPQLPFLEGPQGDATRFREWLLDSNGGDLPEQNTRMILSGPEEDDPLDARPVLVDIIKAFRDFGIEKNEKIGSRLYFYFSGHGFGAEFDDVGMLMANAAPKRLNSNIGLRPFRKFFNNFAYFNEVVYILDCCRNDTQKGQTIGLDFTPSKKGLKGKVSDFVVMAASYGEKAFEKDDTKGRRSGVLTQVILEGLNGKALDPLGRITSSKLWEYVKENVPRVAQDAKLKQVPQVSTPEPDIVFVTVSADKLAALDKVEVRIIAPPGLAGDLMLIDDESRTVSQRSAASAAEDQPPWLESLRRSSLYVVQSTGGALKFIKEHKGHTGAEPFVFRF